MAISRNVLIVEDDNALAEMCAKLIRRRGHSALIANSAHDALEIVQTGAEVDAVVSDIQMPRMSGIELLAQLRGFDAELPIILMTGGESAVSAAEALSLGATDYLSKPFPAETLIGSLERSFRI